MVRNSDGCEFQQCATKNDNSERNEEDLERMWSKKSVNFRRKSSVFDADMLERGQWANPIDFIMSMIAYAVGLGNVWRFPYLCYKNGGGSFLVVYFIFFCLAAVPIFLMEVTVGQYIQRGAMEMWNLCPLFKGVGIGNVIISFMCISYFCVIVSWSLFYLINSFHATFPWETCDNWWNDNSCITGRENSSTLAAIKTNLSQYDQLPETSVEQYWERRVLQQSDSIYDFGGIQWELFALMVVAWLIVYFALRQGITQARKFVYFCAISPYFLLAILFIRGVTLPGAMTGILYYLTPNITKLYDTTVWKDAGTQVFYSYGVGFGTLIALGSHNKREHNCYRDAFVMCIINGSTSIFAGFAVFSILGYMSMAAQKPIGEIVKPGVGLAFLAYPEVASILPFKQLWAVLFFCMISILGIDSQVCMLEGFFIAIEDAFPTVIRKHKPTALAIICTIFFIIGIPMVSYAGSHWLTLLDAYGASGIALLFVVFFEVMGLSWGFGAERVRDSLKTMIKIEICPFWVILWKYITPLATAILFFFSVFKYVPMRYPSGEYIPQSAEIIGFLLSAVSISSIPLYALYYLFVCNRRLPFFERLKRGIRPPVNLKSNQVKPFICDEELKFIDAGRDIITSNKA